MAHPDGTWPALALTRAGASAQLSGFGRPFGLASDAVGYFYVCDMDVHGVARLSPDLAQVSWLADDGSGWTQTATIARGTAARAQPRTPRRLNGPHSVSISGAGAFWIATYYSPGLHQFDADGRHRETRTTIGGRALEGPATARLDRSDNLLITEFRLNCVWVADASGNALGALGGGALDGLVPVSGFAASSAPGAFDRPHMTTKLADGSYVVADTWNHRLQLFDEKFKWRAWLGSGCERWCEDAPAAAAAGEQRWLSTPVAVGAAPDGRFVVTDWGNNEVVWYDAAGTFLAAEAGLVLQKPYDAQILGSQLVVADAHNGRVLFNPAT